jgi:hypothetical protein
MNDIEEYKRKYFEYIFTPEKTVSAEFAYFLNHTFGTQKIDGKIINWVFYEGMDKSIVENFIKHNFQEIYEKDI